MVDRGPSEICRGEEEKRRRGEKEKRRKGEKEKRRGGWSPPPLFPFSPLLVRKRGWNVERSNA
jgi:hypothetical protein